MRPGHVPSAYVTRASVDPVVRDADRDSHDMSSPYDSQAEFLVAKALYAVLLSLRAGVDTPGVRSKRAGEADYSKEHTHWLQQLPTPSGGMWTGPDATQHPNTLALERSMRPYCFKFPWTKAT